MLFSPFIESKPTEGNWVVALPDDKPKPFSVVLNIIHGNFSAVPMKPSLQLLYDILQTTHKYDMTESARPWASDWPKLVEGKRGPKRSAKNVPILVFIAWEPGAKSIFEDLLGEIMMNCYLTRAQTGLVMTDSRGRGLIISSLAHPLSLTG